MDAATFPASFGWMPLNVDQLLAKTANKTPEETMDYLQSLLKKQIAKREHFHERAQKAARARWKIPPGTPSKRDAQANATSIKKQTEQDLATVTLWIANAQKRREKSRKAANIRWHGKDEKGHAKSSGEKSQKHERETLSRSPGSLLRLLVSTLTPPTPPSFSGQITPEALQAFAATGVDISQQALPSARAATALSTLAKGCRSLFDPKKQKVSDPRFESFKNQVFDYWKILNPDYPKCPWIRRDERALEQLLEGSPELTLETFHRWLAIRSRSEISCSELPRRWLADLAEYADGPLDRFKKPLRAPGGGYR